MKSNSIKILSAIITASIIIGCSNNNHVALEQKIQKLEKSNDSLRTLLDTLKTKYIFDNVFVRHVPSENKSYMIGDTYKGEFYFVAFNDEDRVLFSENNAFSDVDTLQVKRRTFGTYDFTTTINSNTTELYFKPIIKNKTALQFQNLGYNERIIADKKIIK